MASKWWVDWERSRFRRGKIKGSALDQFAGPVKRSQLRCQVGRWWSSFRLVEHIENKHLLSAMQCCRTGRDQRGREGVPEGAREPPSFPGHSCKEDPACEVEKDQTVSSEVEGEPKEVGPWKPTAERASRGRE